MLRISPAVTVAAALCVLAFPGLAQAAGLAAPDRVRVTMTREVQVFAAP